MRSNNGEWCEGGVNGSGERSDEGGGVVWKGGEGAISES